MPTVLPIRIELNGTVYEAGRLVLSSDFRAPQRMAFRYSPFWLENGFALGSDLPLVESIQYPAESAPEAAFGFVRDHQPHTHAETLVNRGDLFGLKFGETGVHTSPPDLFALQDREKHRFSALDFELTHSFSTLFSFDTKQRKTALNFVRLLENGINPRTKLNQAEFEAAMASCTALPGRRLQALVTLPDTGREEWVMRVRSAMDTINTPLWTHVTQGLAAGCGLDVLPSRYEAIGTDGVQLSPRFDRLNGRRLFCLSAATLCRRPKKASEPLSYLDVADVINAQGARPKRDLAELFNRLLFDTLSGNRHDAAENIWFYRANGGWNLAPMAGACIEPSPIRTRLLPLALTGNDTTADPELALTLASYFGVRAAKAKETLLRMKKHLFTWRDTALKLGANPMEVNAMQSSFYD